MKKQWNNPQISQLGIEETMGGTSYNPNHDGAAWIDEKGKWQQPVGKS